MLSKSIAIVVLYTNDKKILLQERKTMSKWGEEWSYFGGKIENGENAEEAARREIKEELGINHKEISYLGKISKELTKKDGTKWNITYELFTSQIKEDLSQFTLTEGDSCKFFTIQEARKLVMAPEIDSEVLDMFEKLLK